MYRQSGGPATVRARLLIAALVMIAQAGSSADFRSWTRRAPVTFVAYDKTETLTNFPVLIRLSPDTSGFRYADFGSPATGADLRFTAANQADELSYETERWDTTGVSFVWVRVPELVDSNTVIWAFWGNDAAGAPDYATNGSVWSGGYAAVWHMNNNPAGPAPQVRDSSPNARHGTTAGGMTTNDLVPGAVGQGLSFDGTNDYATAALGAVSAPFTLEAWGYFRLLAQPANDYDYILQVGSPLTNMASISRSNATYYSFSQNTARLGPVLPGQQWLHVTAIHATNAPYHRVYVNGVRATNVSDHTAAINTDGSVNLGRYSGNTHFLSGRSDEIRVFRGERSSNWVWATWASQSTGMTFVSIGPAQTAVVVRALAATAIGPTNATLNGRVAADGGLGSVNVSICWGTADVGTGAPAAWPNVVPLGGAWQSGDSFSRVVGGLSSGSSYVYRCYGSNSAGEAWSEAAVSFTTVYPPVVTNAGAVNGYGTAALRGQILDTGGETPEVWFLYGIAGGGVSGVVAMGRQSGVFSNVVSGLVPGETYSFRIVASNAAGSVTTPDAPFRSLSAARYVSRAGSGTGGTNWATAYTNLQAAINASGNGDFIYVAGQTFSNPATVSWASRANMAIQGGFAATNSAEAPGTSDPARWPTVLTRTGGNMRILSASGITNGALRSLTIQGGFWDEVASLDAMGLSVARCVALTIDSCAFTNNRISNGGTGRGGAVFIETSAVFLSNCLFIANVAGATANGSGYGGAIYVNSGVTTSILCRIIGNSSAGAGGGTAHGGGVYALAGSTNVFLRCVFSRNATASSGGAIASGGGLLLENCLIDHNNSAGDHSDGIYAAGPSVIQSCTVADNGGGVGILSGGAGVRVRNSIVWGHADDLKGFGTDSLFPPTLTNVSYCCIQGGDNNGRQGCISLDPQFVDTNVYHVRSRAGAYTNGAFSGGGWAVFASNSPAIDAGDPASAFGREPAPNGGRLNLGAYGNTEVASLSDTTSPVATPAVTNLGATMVSHRSVRLSAVTAGGDPVPWCGFDYWPAAGGLTSTVSAGPQDGRFFADIGGLAPAAGYQFVAFASNAGGRAVSEAGAFATRAAAAGLYVATNGANTDGSSWSAAYTNLQAAFDGVEPGDTIYLAGHVFPGVAGFQQTTLWIWRSRSNVTVRGGFAATNDADLPGVWDPVRWPTALRLGAQQAQVLLLSGITNSVIRDVTIRDGYYNQVGTMDGVGMGLIQCRGLTLDGCVFTNNASYVQAGRGGGLFADASVLFLTNCLFVKNVAGGAGNGRGSGGGLYVNSGVVTMMMCRVIANTASHANNPGSFPFGGGVCLAGGVTGAIRRTVISQNVSTHTSGGGAGLAALGRLLLENCLVDHNLQASHTSDGIYAAGNATIANCTVADNGNGVGILYAGGTVAISNSIVWRHADDLKGFPSDGALPPTFSNISFSCIRDGDNNGRQGCISLDPLFADTNTYHLQSPAGCYTGGAFGAGVWTTAPGYSPAIDAGDPVAAYANEPEPNGRRINLGAYGNTEVASLTDTSQVVGLPAVDTRGASLIGHRTVRLNGQVLGTGGQIPQCRFDYWLVGGAVTSSVSAGPQVDVFSSDVAGLTPGGSYQFVVVAANTAGSVSSIPLGFSTHPPAAGLYVSTNGDNTAGSSWSTAYRDPQTAFDIAEPGDTVLLAGQRFSGAPGFQQDNVWRLVANRDVTVIGGYAAAGDIPLPGANDPDRWPTVLRSTATSGRVWYLGFLTNCAVRNLTIADGNHSGIAWNGAGLYVGSCTGLTFAACVFTNNRCYSGFGVSGGAVYASGSSITFSNCLLIRNEAGGTGNASGQGGGVYATASRLTVWGSVFRGNSTYGSGQNPRGYGGGLALASGYLSARESVFVANRAYGSEGYGGALNLEAACTSVLRNCVIVTNDSSNNDSDGVRSLGTLAMSNCTVAFNGGVGVRASGDASVRGSILWGNGDDLTGAVALAYCDIQTADRSWTSGVNGCMSQDPLFADPLYLHEQSRQGHYTNGWFTGGGWGYSTSNSPCIDAGDPGDPYGAEPPPHGYRINMGAYGNTTVASRSDTRPGILIRVR